jgi:putative nucleotidyltransferase with HDIG domain
MPDLELVASKARDLPPMPVIALKALEMSKDPKTSLRDLQAVIGKDQALSARILRIVNSAMYCLSREVSTLSHAMAILGMDTVRSILMAATIHQVYRNSFAGGKDLGSKLLADHSWGAAIAARAIALRIRYENPEEAFLCSLMHDIGKPVLLKNFPDQYTKIFGEVYKGAGTFDDAEARAFGFSHAHVGAVIAEKWKFPPQMVEAIGYHHSPLAAPRYSHLACITDLSSKVMVVMEVGFEKNKDLKLEAQPAAEFLKLSQPGLESLVTDVRSAYEDLSKAMKS